MKDRSDDPSHHERTLLSQQWMHGRSEALGIFKHKTNHDVDITVNKNVLSASLNNITICLTPNS